MLLSEPDHDELARLQPKMQRRESRRESRRFQLARASSRLDAGTHKNLLANLVKEGAAGGNGERDSGRRSSASRRSCCSQRASMAMPASDDPALETIPASPQPPRAAWPSARRVLAAKAGGSFRKASTGGATTAGGGAPGGLLAADRRLSDVTEGPNEELRRTSAEDPESNRRLSEVTEAKEEREGGDLRI